MLERYINKAANFVLKKFGRQVSFGTLPHRKNIITLCAIEYESLPKAIYLPEHLSRFLESNEFFSMENEYKRLFATYTDHVPTLMIPFGKCFINNYGMINNKLEHYPRKTNPSKSPQISSTKNDSLKSALLVDGDFSEQFFGHWLHDEMPSAMIAHNQLPAIAIHQANFIHAAGYLELFKPNINYGFRGTVDSLNLLVDFSQNSFKKSRYETLRKRLESKNFTSIKFKGVYVARGQSGSKRSLNNEDELINHLTKADFDVIYPEKLQPAEIVARLWNAPIIITVEGSAIAHAIYTIANHGGVLVLQPPRRICHVFKGILDAKNNPYGFYVCQPSEDEKDSFYVDSFSDLDKLIDQLREESAKRALRVT